MSGNRRESTNSRPVGEEPPYLAVGTEVSAKYRGAFCEASIKSVKKLVKCKVNFNDGGSSTIADDCIIGEVKVGSDVKVKTPDGHDACGTLVKITDSSSYTVVFDDGDERTLKRTSLCIKGEKHFNESETLDHLPLTDPENFGTPVMQQGKKSRKGRRSSVSLDESIEQEEIPARKKLNVKKDENVDKVVMIDFTEKKKSFVLPALLLCSTGSHGKVENPENVFVRSFKDGKLIEVHPKDVKEFLKESVVNSTLIKGENPSLKLAVEHAVKYLETKQLPSNWCDDKLKPEEVLKNENSDHSSSSELESDGDEHDKSEFLEKLTKFLGDKGTPLVRSPVLGHRDLDLYKLFKIVSKMKGMDKVDSWHSVYKKMNIPIMTTTASYHIKNAYKRYLYNYEIHTREEEKNTVTEKAKKSKRDEKLSRGNASNNVAINCSKEEETPVGSDSEKYLKELPLVEDKLPSQRKPPAKRGRGRRKARTARGISLKSPNSPGLSPLSPCSPKSISSVSASESIGCPSPAENYCDVRELRGKIDLVLGKSSISKVDDTKGDLPDKNGDSDSSKDSFNYKTRKEKKGKENCESETVLLKLENNMVNHGNNMLNQGNNMVNQGNNMVNQGENVQIEDEAGDESTCNEHASVQENEKHDCKKTEREGEIKNDSLSDEEDLKNVKNIQDDGSSFDEGDDDDPDDGGGGKTEDLDTHVDNLGQDGTDVEDTVDVVNSPSGTSETVDSDDRDDQKPPEKKAKRSGKGEPKSNDVSDDVNGLEYKLNDRIDVRYGRGRNATIYHAKITCIDPCADEGLFYLVHYQGWNSRHDEWIGHARIIGRGVKQTRTRTIKEPSKTIKPTPKPSAKPTPKPVPVKKNGKNGAGHVGRPPGSKTRKRTPSPTANTVASSRNGNGRACKNRKDAISEKTISELGSEVKCPSRTTRRNSLSIPLEALEHDLLDLKSPDTKSESGKDSLASPCRSQRAINQQAKSPSPKCHVENSSEPTAAKDEKKEAVKLDEDIKVEEPSDGGSSAESSPSAMEMDYKVEVEKTLKRSREDDIETSSTDSPPAKKRPEDQDSPAEEVFEEDIAESPSKETTDPESDPTADDANAPDLTCSEQLPTHCASPDPYTSVFPEAERVYENGVESAEHGGNGSKEKDSSSSLDEGKAERPTSARKAKCRRRGMARAPSSQSSVETSECNSGISNGPTVTVMLSPSWTPRYNFTEDLDELLKNEESSERIRLLTERIKDIRKVYGELKSEVANIDRKRKRKQKRKREEEMSAEENATRSPSRSSPLTTTTVTAVSSANALAAVECR